MQREGARFCLLFGHSRPLAHHIFQFQFQLTSTTFASNISGRTQRGMSAPSSFSDIPPHSATTYTQFQFQLTSPTLPRNISGRTQRGKSGTASFSDIRAHSATTYFNFNLISLFPRRTKNRNITRLEVRGHGRFFSVAGIRLCSTTN